MSSAHHHHELSHAEWAQLNQRARAGVPRWEIVMIVLIVLGVVGFFLGLGSPAAGPSTVESHELHGTHGATTLHAAHEPTGHAPPAQLPPRAFQAFWINFLFWSGLAQAGVAFSAMVFLTRGQWGPSIVRLGLLQIGFVPVTLLLYLGAALCAPSIFGTAHHDLHEGFKAWWLDRPFLLIRDGLSLLILVAISLMFAMNILRPERGVLAEQSGAAPPKKWLGFEAERERMLRRGVPLAIMTILAYAWVYSLLAFDFIMSLEPHWYSTMFGGYFFVTSIYLGLAAIIVWAALLRRRVGMENQLGTYQFHNISKILFGFCILSAYTFFAQYLPIWYGDLPEETSYFLHRQEHPVWLAMSLAVIFGGFFIPFFILLNQRVKMIPPFMAALGVFILLVGLTERSLTVMPPLRPGVTSLIGGVIGPSEILITLGFVGLYGLVMLSTFRRAILVPVDWKLKPVAH